MKTLVYGAGPIGQWLALRLHQAGADVTLLARNDTLDQLMRDSVQIVDGLSGTLHHADVPLTDRLAPDDRYELVIVAMQKRNRRAVCPVLAENRHVMHILFMGNDVSGMDAYQEEISIDKILLGFPDAGGGIRDGQMVVMDQMKPRGPNGGVYFGELDGTVKERDLQIKSFFESAGIKAIIERNMDGWLKYHYAFMAPTAGVILLKGGNTRAVADDREAIHLYCAACREAGNVLRRMGYPKRQPPVFNLYYWLPKNFEPKVFSKMFASEAAKIRFGLHAQSVVPELLEMSDEFAVLKAQSGCFTPSLDLLLDHVRKQTATFKSGVFPGIPLFLF